MMFKSGLMTSGAAMLACATIGAIGHPALQLMRRNGVQTGLDLGALIRAVTEFLEDKNAYVSKTPSSLQGKMREVRT